MTKGEVTHDISDATLSHILEVEVPWSLSSNVSTSSLSPAVIIMGGGMTPSWRCGLEWVQWARLRATNLSLKDLERGLVNKSTYRTSQLDRSYTCNHTHTQNSWTTRRSSLQWKLQINKFQNFDGTSHGTFVLSYGTIDGITGQHSLWS